MEVSAGQKLVWTCYLVLRQIVVMAFFLSSHPASSTIRGVVQSLGGDGEQGVALFLEIEEVTIRRGVSAAGREAADGVCGGIDASARYGEYLAPYEK